MLSREDQRLVIHPPLATGALPGIGGRTRTTPEDFRVTEIPAYPPDGQEGRHVFVRMRKRGWNTESAAGTLARHLGIARFEIGLAGLKDRDAVTEQWLSVPWSAYAKLDTFEHPDIELFEAIPHGQKLRRGHLRGNEFDLVVRNLAVPVTEALDRGRAKLDALGKGGGLWNLYGIQRFGHDGKNLTRGFDLIESGRPRAKDHLFVSAAQSGLFNLYVLERAAGAGLQTVVPGDLLQKTDTGGLFESHDPVLDQPRLDRGELVLTGPIFGSKTKEPPYGTASWDLETRILERGGITRDDLWKLGKRAPGSRRAVCVDVSRVAIEPEGDDALRLRFTLPAGSYATQLLAELQGPA